MNSSSSSRRAKRFNKKLVPTLFLVVLSAAILYPLYFVLLASLKGANEVRANAIGLPTHWLFSNYITAWTKGDFSIYFKNSIIIVIPVVFMVIFCSLLASFALTRIKPWGSPFFFIFLIAGQTLPLEAIIIPLYYQMNRAHLLNNPLSVILPMIGLIIPFGVLLLTGFIDSIPSDILDAAKVDGASTWQELLFVVLPISQPGVVALLVFSFLWTWNQFFLPTVMLPQPAARTLPAGLNQFIGTFTYEMQLLAAGTLITAVPVIIIYLIFNNQFIRGITTGAVK
jgi:ABC-type glycerol-3-phosphate transport system permease component